VPVIGGYNHCEAQPRSMLSKTGVDVVGWKDVIGWLTLTWRKGHDWLAVADVAALNDVIGWMSMTWRHGQTWLAAVTG